MKKFGSPQTGGGQELWAFSTPAVLLPDTDSLEGTLSSLLGKLG